MADPLGRAAVRAERAFGESWAWITQDSGEALFGAAIAGAILVALWLLKWGALRLLPREFAGAPSLLRALVARTLSLFLIAAALDGATHAVALPGPLMRLVDNLFTIALAVQGALWIRELVLGLVHRRAGHSGWVTRSVTAPRPAPWSISG